MQSLSKYAPYALAILRIVTALLFIEHGTAKLLGFPAMPGADQAGGSLPPLILFAALLEVFGGLAILAGFFTRPVAFILSGMMAVAYWMAHVPKGGLFPLSNGGDAAVLFCFIFLYLVFAGAGAWSVHGARSPRDISS
jgi:putative oxidoreductase